MSYGNGLERDDGCLSEEYSHSLVGANMGEMNLGSFAPFHRMSGFLLEAIYKEGVQGIPQLAPTHMRSCLWDQRARRLSQGPSTKIQNGEMAFSLLISRRKNRSL